MRRPAEAGVQRKVSPLRLKILFILVSGFAGAVTPGLAQTLRVDDLPEAQKRLQDDIERTDKAAAKARAARILESGGEVSYRDVLADPDNIELNIRFAQTQIRDGNIRGASATLERVLLLDPDRADVRLLYAVVLFRLDNLQDAERELESVRDLPMTPQLRTEVSDLLDQIDQRRRRLRFEALVSFGGQYDWNGSSTPVSNTRLVSDVPIQLGDADQRHREFSANGTVRIAMDYDLGFQRRHKLKAGVSGYRAEHLHEDQLDLEAVSADAGLSMAYEPFTVEPRFSVTDVRLAHQRYLTIARLENLATWQVDKKADLFAGLGWEDQHYNSVHVATSAWEREGRQIDGRIGGHYLVEPTLRIGGYARLYDKNAKKPYNAYHRAEAGAEATMLLSGGSFLIASVVYQRDSYQAPDPFVSAATRNDWSLRSRLLYGFPIANLFDDRVAGWFEGITATVAVERYNQVSTIRDYTYRNTSVSANLTRKWTF